MYSNNSIFRDNNASLLEMIEEHCL